MKKHLSALFLVIPVGILVLSTVITSIPGALLSFYLIGIVFCIPNIGFSKGWPKYTAIILSFIFIVISLSERNQGIRYAHLMGERDAKIKQVQSKEDVRFTDTQYEVIKKAEQGAAANP